MSNKNDLPLLAADDPPAVEIVNPTGSSSFLLIGDHAGNAFPRRLGTMGLSEQDQKRHISWDIGVRHLGERLSYLFDATFIFQPYSRLVVDCNRSPTAADAIAVISDGTVVKGNSTLSDADRQRRFDEVHKPYHHAIETELSHRQRREEPTVLISLHSFTPSMDGKLRPWHIGVLHDGGNKSFATEMLSYLAERTELVVGDNEPYRMDTVDYTVPRHAFPRQIKYAELEIRQDLLSSNDDAERWAKIIATAARQARG